jgi:hypothetical protein
MGLRDKLFLGGYSAAVAYGLFLAATGYYDDDSGDDSDDEDA